MIISSRSPINRDFLKKTESTEDRRSLGFRVSHVVVMQVLVEVYDYGGRNGEREGVEDRGTEAERRRGPWVL